MSRSRLLPAAAVSLVLATALAACGGSGDAATSAAVVKDGKTTVKVAEIAGPPYTPVDISVPVQEAIRAKLPASVKNSGKLVIGEGALPAGFAPLAFVGTDQKTLTGSEPDLGRLIAAVLGLKPEIVNATWENLFVGIDSGRTDVGFSNITVTEERKKKYDFSSYRDDNLAFEVKKDSTWNFDNNPENLNGQVVSVGRGTNQEKILLEWQKKLQAEGKNFKVVYFPDNNTTYLALNSGKITAYFGPNPTSQYNISKAGKTRNAGTFSGAGETLQGLIAATTKKGNGLVEPINEAINYLITNGQYATWLKAYNLSNESVDKAEVNPPGLPLDNS